MILVMTTNAGVRETERKSIGLVQQDNSTDAMEEIKKVFTPEFRNRLDNIIWFNHLSTEVIQQVVDKFIVELQAQLDAKGVSLEVSDDARDWLSVKGYDRAMGARPMARVMQENLKTVGQRTAVRLAGGRRFREGRAGQRQETADLPLPQRRQAQGGRGRGALRPPSGKEKRCFGIAFYG